MRIAIVNDLELAIAALRRVLLSRRHEVAWVARDGAEAVELCARDLPDLLLMDLFMPRMNGVEATRRIMSRTPCPILVVTADVSENSSKVFEAMGAGALDAANTPVLHCPGAAKGAETLLGKIERLGKVLGHPSARKSALPVRPRPAALNRAPEYLVAVGASAGGPAALGQLLAALPADFTAPLVVVQHVDAQFAQGLANWLEYQTPLRVKLAQQGDQPKAGEVLLAGRDRHLICSAAGQLGYSEYPENCVYRPSVDVFFESLSDNWSGKIVGVLLTGMGKDGAEGLRGLREKGHHTIAQDQASSAVFGMPKAAAELRAAKEILPLSRIPGRLMELVNSQKTACQSRA